MEESLWAKMETRVRRLVFDLLEPSINRVADHKDMLENLRRTDDQLSRKIDTLDILTDKLTKRLAVVDEFSRKILQFDSTIHVQEATFAQDRESMRNELETFLKQLTSAEENISNLIGQSSSLRTDLVNLTFETNNSRQHMSFRIEEIRNEMIKMVQDLEYKHKGLDNYSGALEKKFNLFLKDFEIVDVIAKKAEHSAEDNMNQLKIIFKNFTAFKKETKDGVERVRNMAMQFSQAVTDQMKGLKDKFNMEVPVQTQLIVSENLHAVLELKEKKLLAELEQEKFAEWDIMVSGNTFEDQIQAARRRTQEVIDKPLPKPERVVPVTTYQAPVDSPKAEIRQFPKKPEKSSRAEVRIKEKRVKIEKLDEEDHQEKEEIQEKKENNVEELKNDEGHEAEPEKKEEGVGENEKIEENEGIAEKNEEGLEKTQETTNAIQVVKPFDLNDIKKNSLAIMQILGITEVSEEVSIINEFIKKIQDDQAISVKKLQNLNAATEEKVQLLLKKQFETTQRIEELKTIQQNQALKSESDKKELEQADANMLKILSRDISDITAKVADINYKFGVLDRETQAKLNTFYENFEKLNKTTEKFLISQEKNLQIFYDDISKSNQILDLQIQQAALECNAAVTQRKRDHCDNQAEFRKIQGIFESYSKKSEQVNKNIENFSRTVSLLIEFARIVHVLMQQDEVDRESIALFGVKDSKSSKNKSSVIIDKQCLSCSGQPNFITSAFKLACLAYSPNSVMFKETVYERFEMIELLRRIVEGIAEDTVSEFGMFDMQKHSISAKPTHFRPSSRQSNLSFSQSLVSATPDLPPLAFPKRFG